jgi:hypothetical protein
MRQKISSIIALICITVYVLALGIAAYRIVTGVNERQRLAEREFAELVDVSSAAGVLGFMNEPFRETIQDALFNSQTLEAVIISSPLGVDTFEREPGRIITWVGESPRFKTALGLSAEPFFRPLRLDGIRNTTISAVSNYIDYDGLITILKYTLIAVLAALGIAFITLLLESFQGKGGAAVTAGTSRAPEAAPVPEEEDFFEGEDLFAGEATAAPEVKPSPKVEPVPAGENPPEEEKPQGLYSPLKIGWEDYTKDRLSSELHRCAAAEQDLVFIMVEFKTAGNIDEPLFIQFIDEAVKYFTHRDMIFEKGNRGVSVIIPNIDLDQGMAKSENFHDRVLRRLSPNFQKTDLCIGLSSRSGRIIDEERLIFETEKALEKALGDPESPVVAFKSDPEKYRAFIASKNKRRP